MNLSAEDFSSALSGDIAGLARTASKLVGGMSRGLTDAQRKRIVDVLISEDPEMVRRALQDQSGMAMLQRAVDDISARLASGARRGAVILPAEAGGGATGGLLAQ